MVPLLGAAIIFGGFWLAAEIVSKTEGDGKGIEEEIKIEKRIWNNGRCDKCGGKWHLRYFYPKGSKGEYQYAAITCHKCKRKAELMFFKPNYKESRYTQVDRFEYYK